MDDSTLDEPRPPQGMDLAAHAFQQLQQAFLQMQTHETQINRVLLALVQRLGGKVSLSELELRMVSQPGNLVRIVQGVERGTLEIHTVSS